MQPYLSELEAIVKSLSHLVPSLKALLFRLEEPTGHAINMVIIGLFAIGVCNVIAAALRLARERNIIRRARAALRKRAKNLSADSKIDVLKLLKIPRRSLLGRRVERLIRLRAAGLDPRDVLQQLTTERLEGYGALARYIGMVLTLIGLLGTVLGLSLAILKAQTPLAATYDFRALNDLAQALLGTLGGMKTAFATTFAGLITAIPLSLCNHVVRRLQSRCMTQLEDLVVCELMPALPQREPEAHEAATNFARMMTAAAAELNEVRDIITQAAGHYQTSSQTMAVTVRTFETAVVSLGQSLTANQDEFIQTMAATREAASEMANTHAQQLQEFTKIFEEQRTGLKAFSDMTFDVNANIATLFEKLANAEERDLQEVTQVVEGMQNAVQSMHRNMIQVTDNQQTFTQSMSETREAVQTMAAAITQQFDDLRVFTDTSSQALEVRLTEIAEKAETVQSLHEHLDKLVKNFQDSVKTTHGQAQDIMRDLFKELIDQVGNDLKVSFKSLSAEIVKQHGDEVQRAVSQNSKGIESIVDQHNAALHTFSDMVVDVNLQMSTLVDKIASAVNGHAKAGAA